MIVFLQEELELLRCYDTKWGLTALLNQLQAALPHIEDKQAADTTADCIDKLCRMTPSDYPWLEAQLDSCTLH